MIDHVRAFFIKNDVKQISCRHTHRTALSKHSYTKIFCIYAAIFLDACSSQRALVVERSTNKTTNVGTSIANAPITSAGYGFYRVKPGDTLYRIALEHGQAYKDIVLWNNLINPNQIEINQLLRVLPPRVISADRSHTDININSSVINNSLTNNPDLDGDHQVAAPIKREKITVTALSPNDNLNTSNTVNTASVSNNTNTINTSNTVNNIESKTKVNDINLRWPTKLISKNSLIAFDGVKNKGIDILGSFGDLVMAAADGKVVYAGSGLRGYGNLIIIKHSNIYLSAYAHNQTLLVKEGAAIKAGQEIANMGRSDSDTVKLHFELRRYGKPIDPIPYLPKVF